MFVEFLKKVLSNKQKENIKLFLYKKPHLNNTLKFLDFSHVKIRTTNETLESVKELIIKNKKGCYIRFGDGDVYVLKNVGKHRNQKYDSQLSNELKEAIGMTGDTVLKSLAINSEIFGVEEFMEFGVHQVPDGQAKKLLCNSYEFFIGEKIYSPVALHYELIYNKAYAIELLKLLRSYKPIFVGSEQNNPEVIKRLLNSNELVKTSHKNTYESVNELESNIIGKLSKRNLDYDIVVLSCGSTAKALIKRLYLNYDKPIFLFDMGSVVDLFHNRMQWTWVKKSGIDSHFLESILLELENS